MNRIRLSKLLYILLLLALVACQAASAPPTLSPSAVPASPTSVPATAIPATLSLAPTAVPPAPAAVPPTQAPTAKPLGEHVVAEWEVTTPQGSAFGFGSVWVPSHRDPNATTRIDPVSNKVIAVIQGTGYRSHIAIVVGDSVWVSGEKDDTVRIDPNTNLVVATVPGAHTDMAGGFDSIWATTRTDTLDRIDPATNKIIASIRLSDNSVVDCNNSVLATATAMWVDHCDEREWIKIDPATNSIVSKTAYDKLISEAKAQTKVPAGKGTDFIWTALPSGLLRMDPKTGVGLTFLPLSNAQNSAVGFPPAVTDDAVWVAGEGQIERVDVATNQIDATYKISVEDETRLGIGFGSLWASYEFHNLVQRLDVAP